MKLNITREKLVGKVASESCLTREARWNEGWGPRSEKMMAGEERTVNEYFSTGRSVLADLVVARFA